MPEKLTLAVYLERRGAVKALTRIEAEVFGVPYPLVKGWAHRHGAGEITQAMLDQLQEKIGRARSSTAEKAQRGLDGLCETRRTVDDIDLEVTSRARFENPAKKVFREKLFPGFSLKGVNQKIKRHSRLSYPATQIMDVCEEGRR